jgi:antitoxin MazE
MKTRVINIGNSKGIRIPKVLLQQAQLEQEVILEVKKEGILIKPEKKKKVAREGWDLRMKEAAKKYKTKENLWGDFGNDFDKTEWTW